VNGANVAVPVVDVRQAMVHAGVVLELAKTKPRDQWQHEASACLPSYIRGATHWKKRIRATQASE
jgi:hypothetical protein